MALPEEFWTADCIVQATAGHGIKPGMRLRLWFWLSRPLGRGELDRWFANSPVDRSVFRTVQAIYTAAPVFENDAARITCPHVFCGCPAAWLRCRLICGRPTPKAIIRTGQTHRRGITRKDQGTRSRQRTWTASLPRHLTSLHVPMTARGTRCCIAPPSRSAGFGHIRGGRRLRPWGGCSLPCPRQRIGSYARQTAQDGVRAGARRPFVNVNSIAPEFGPLPPLESEGTTPSKHARLLSIDDVKEYLTRHGWSRACCRKTLWPSHTGRRSTARRSLRCQWRSMSLPGKSLEHHAVCRMTVSR